MAEPETGNEPDIDAMDDAQFAELKQEMRKGVNTPADDKQPDPVPKDGARDEQGRFKAKAEDAKAPAEEDGDGSKPAETVPHGQFHRERERRKAAEEAADKIRADYTKLMERTSQLLQRDTDVTEAETAPAIPRWTDNPIEAGQWTQEQIIAMREEQRQAMQKEQERAQASQYWSNIISTANQQFAEAEKTDPTVRDAYEGLKASYAAELKAMGHTPQSVDQQLAVIEAQGIQYALTNNIPVAEYVVGLAKARGWQPKAPANDTGKSEADKIAEREQTRLASLSLGRGGGAVPNTGAVTPEQLLEMSDDEFAAFKKKHSSVASAFRAA